MPRLSIILQPNPPPPVQKNFLHKTSISNFVDSKIRIRTHRSSPSYVRLEIDNSTSQGYNNFPAIGDIGQNFNQNYYNLNLNYSLSTYQTVFHKYDFVNVGPSDIEQADIVIGLPNLYRSDYSNLKSLLYLDSPQFYDIYHENETPAGGKVSCRFLDSTREYPVATPGNDGRISGETSPNTEAINTLKNWGFVGQRCRRKCLYFKCSVSKLYAQQNVELHIGIKLKSMKECACNSNSL